LLEASSQVRSSEFFVALTVLDGLNTAESRIGLACGIEKDWLRTYGALALDSWTEYDEKTQKFLKFTAQSLRLPPLGSLPLSEVRSSPAQPDDCHALLTEIAFAQRDVIFEKNEHLHRWWVRFQFWLQSHPDQSFSESTLQEIFSAATYGEISLTALFEKDLVALFEAQLSREQNQKFKSQCPEFLSVPSGSQIRIDYSANSPAIEVRLQEVFGLNSTPKILEGRLAITLVLLGPNYRPVQVTQDLASFWKNGYPEVRKELRARYPKHSWPEDPLTALAVAKGRPRH
jgi:ATP-dependent helicase HrpB